MSRTEAKLSGFIRTLGQTPDEITIKRILKQANSFRNSAKRMRDEHAANEALAAKVVQLAEKHLTKGKRNG